MKWTWGYGNREAFSSGLFLSMMFWLLVQLQGIAQQPVNPDKPHNATSKQAIHLLNRLTYGPKPQDIQRVEKMGVEAYIQQQLHPERIGQPLWLSGKLHSMESLQSNPVQLFQKYNTRFAPANAKGDRSVDAKQFLNFVKTTEPVASEIEEARLMQALYSERQLQEVMVDFWYNHFNVFAHKGPTRIWVGNYEEKAIRPYALGKFRDLLGATVKHPAMLFYLDNWENTAPGSQGARGKQKGLNENYARELMELHTLGVNGGYSQKDVMELARILTGWGLPAFRRMQGQQGRTTGLADVGARMKSLSTGFYFDATRHDNGPKILLGKTFQGEGVEEGERALDLLAKHPATAKHIAHELAQYFVSDTPSPALETALSQKFMETDGDIRSVMNTLLHHPDFWQAQNRGQKYRSPYRYVLATLRATNTPVKNYPLIRMTMKQMGMPLYGCQTPDGYKNTQEAWLSPDAMIKRVNFATALGSGRMPFDTPMAWGQGKMQSRAAMQNNRQATPIATAPLMQVFGGEISAQTRHVVDEAPEQMKSAVLLASPEMIQY